MTQYINNRAGNPMAADVLRLAKDLQDGPGDGRISKDDAKALANKVNDGGVYTDPERRAVDHLKETDQLNFTPAGKDTFDHEMRSAAAERGWKTRKANQEAQQSAQTSPTQSGFSSQIAARIQK